MRFFIVILTVLLTWLANANADDSHDYLDANGFRGIPYKAPTPEAVPGGVTLDFAEDVQDLLATSNTLPVNVSPITLSPAAKNGKRIWIMKAGKDQSQIPGSVWLPNVGLQTLDPDMMHYLENNLAVYTDNNKERGLLFYCTADCWMSWNTVIRVGRDLGYTNLYWYPSGIDGWKERELPVEMGSPIPFN